MALTTDFGGKWQLEKNENFEAFATAVGMNFVVRKMAANSKPKLTIKQDSEKLDIQIETLMFTRHEVIYTSGEPFDTKGMDGTALTCTAHWDDGALVVTKEPKDKNSKTPKVTTIRRLTPEGKMIEEITVYTKSGEEVVCKRTLNKLSNDK